jgi:hypothetical protein
MNHKELIADQQLEIANLKEKIDQYVESFNEIYKDLYCIGAPLNDNKLKFTADQLLVFRRIARCLPDDL